MKLFLVTIMLVLHIHAGDPIPPVFPNAFSARVHEVAKAPGTYEKIECDLHWDNNQNMTSYRNCGKFGTQMQYVYRFNDTESGPGGKVYFIYGKGPFGNTCAYWCDLQGTLQCNLQESLCTYDYINSAKYNSSATLNGTRVDVFTWEEKLGPISMNSLSLYVQSNHTVPVYQHRDVHPFQKEEGYIDTNFTSFVIGTPDPSAFDIPGIAKCLEGEDAQCAHVESEYFRFLLNKI